MAWVIVPILVTALQLSRGYPVFHALSDGLFTNAVFALGIAVFRLAGNAGCFDLVGYGIRHTFLVHYPKAGQDEDFYTYRSRKRKHPSPVRAPFILAAASLGAALVMLLLAS